MDPRRVAWAGFGGAVLLTMTAVAAGWYGSERNGLSVDSQGHLVPMHASAIDPFLLVMYLLMAMGLYLAVAGLSGRLWLPGVSAAENRADQLQRHRIEVEQMLGGVMRQADQLLKDRLVDPGDWEERTFDLIANAFGPAEAEVFRYDGFNLEAGSLIHSRRGRLIEIIKRFPQLQVREDFVPITWALAWEPSRRDGFNE